MADTCSNEKSIRIAKLDSFLFVERAMIRLKDMRTPQISALAFPTFSAFRFNITGQAAAYALSSTPSGPSYHRLSPRCSCALPSRSSHSSSYALRRQQASAGAKLYTAGGLVWAARIKREKIWVLWGMTQVREHIETAVGLPSRILSVAQEASANVSLFLTVHRSKQAWRLC